jgi:hypothetical protein
MYAVPSQIPDVKPSPLASQQLLDRWVSHALPGGDELRTGMVDMDVVRDACT